MTKLILHIGLQKTGTTFLQQNFIGRAGRLRKAGVHYLSPQGNLPTDKVSAAHHWMVAAVRKMPNAYIPDVSFSFLPQYVANLRQKIERNEYPVALMSSENFSRMNDDQVAAVHKHFEGIETEIVIYLRRQDIWIDSWYTQMVKTGRKLKLEDILEEMDSFLDFRNLITRWGTHFGRQNIRLGIYENLNSPTDLWQDFFTLIGCPSAAKIDLQEESANVTLSPQLAKFIEIAQETTGYNPQLRRFLERVNEQFEPVKSLKFLSEARAQALLENYAEANQEIAKEFCDRDQLFANMDVVGSDSGQSLSIEDIVNIMAGSNIALLKRISDLEKEIAGKGKSPRLKQERDARKPGSMRKQHP